MSIAGLPEGIYNALEEIVTDPTIVLNDDFEEAAPLYIGMAMEAMMRYRKIEDIDELQTAIRLFNKGVNHPSAVNDPNLPAYVNYYATALAKRFGINRDAEDLQKAIQLVKTVFCKVDKDDQSYEKILVSAEECLSAMYEEAGSADALREMIAYGG